MRNSRRSTSPPETVAQTREWDRAKIVMCVSALCETRAAAGSDPQSGLGAILGWPARQVSLGEVRGTRSGSVAGGAPPRWAVVTAADLLNALRAPRKSRCGSGSASGAGGAAQQCP